VRGSYENSKTLSIRGTLTQFEGAGNWLEENVEKGDLVMFASWDQFPVMFYHTHKPYYFGGLDPTFTYHYDEDIYWKWTHVTTGEIRTNVDDVIKELETDWVFVTNSHTDMRRNIEQFTDYPIVYEDEEGAIFRVE